MYTLMVSYNAGLNYSFDSSAINPRMLNYRCDELEKLGLRWYIKDENGSPVKVSSIHKRILGMTQHI